MMSPIYEARSGTRSAPCSSSAEEQDPPGANSAAADLLLDRREPHELPPLLPALTTHRYALTPPSGPGGRSQ